MPPTEQCPLGSENKARIDERENICNEFRAEVKRFMEALTNHYSKKPSWVMALVILALSNTLTGITTALIAIKLIQ